MPTKTVSTPNVNASKSARVAAAASTNATSVLATPGIVDGVNVHNTAAYAVFLKLYNKASAPTVGTDVPKFIVGVAAGARADVAFPKGVYFDTGIAYAITKLVADTDTTVVVANDLQGAISFR